ncbi:hypothetical protein Pcinc_035712 [Petrolisthes cinctipes]|uniref:Uncharacterized protein n=1 Tax=Petrolisthes cinctipes TaxID=88211 RepID=A0AAE1ENB7_PETCI|nr:hypothetical protein Pcinc_035712 [Petrolisthes cinctipes]
MNLAKEQTEQARISLELRKLENEHVLSEREINKRFDVPSQMRGVGDFITVPLTFVQLDSDLVSGKVRVGLVDELPVSGVELLLGNDLAGGQREDPELESLVNKQVRENERDSERYYLRNDVLMRR